MNCRNFWMLALLMLASLMLSACAQRTASAGKIQPAKVEAMDGTNLKRLTLIPEAAKRLDIKTAPVREESLVRTHKFGGEVVTMPTESATTQNAGKTWVRVSLGESGLKRVRRVEPATIFPISNSTRHSDGFTAQPVDAPALPDADPATELYYLVDGTNHGLVAGQRVFAQITLAGSGASRKVIPFAAVLYDKEGHTWTYTSPQSLVFIRQAIAIDYIEGDQAFLFEGPAAGTVVVTYGATELYGAEVGVGK